MPSLPCVETAFCFGGNAINALIPDPEALNVSYRPGTAAPYWARLWPAALGLCEYLAQHPELVRGKRVLELAAGLGLPGLLAATWAKQVTLSDIEPEAVAVMQSSIERNGLRAASAAVIDWNAIPDGIRPEVVLLSDVNYDPELFESLFAALTGLLQRGATVILSTPQRLMAKPFIKRLLPCCREQREYSIDGGFVSVFCLSL